MKGGDKMDDAIVAELKGINEFLEAITRNLERIDLSLQRIAEK